MTIWRSIGAVMLGIIVAYSVVTALEILGVILFPLPPGTDPTNEEQIRKLLEEDKIPAGALACVFSAWVVGAFCGSWVAARLTSSAPLFCGWIVGCCIFLGNLRMLFELPHPYGFAFAALLFVPVASWFGAALGAKQQSGGKAASPAA